MRQKKAGGTARRTELLPPCRLRSMCMEIPQREPCRGAEAVVPSLRPPALLSPCSPARRQGCQQCSALAGDGCRGPAPAPASAPARWRVHTNPALRPRHGAGSRPDGFVPPRAPAPLQEKQTCLTATAADGAFPSPGTRTPPADGGGQLPAEAPMSSRQQRCLRCIPARAPVSNRGRDGSSLVPQGAGGIPRLDLGAEARVPLQRAGCAGPTLSPQRGHEGCWRVLCGLG